MKLHIYKTKNVASLAFIEKHKHDEPILIGVPVQLKCYYETIEKCTHEESENKFFNPYPNQVKDTKFVLQFEYENNSKSYTIFYPPRFNMKSKKYKLEKLRREFLEIK